MYPIILFFIVAFAGFIVFLPKFPAWLGDWAPYGSFMRYSLQAMILNEMSDNPDLPYGQSFIDTLGFQDFSLNQCIPFLFIFLGFFGLLSLWTLKYINFEVR